MKYQRFKRRRLQGLRVPSRGEMKISRKVPFFVFLCAICVGAWAQEYDLSSDVFRSAWQTGTWDGEHNFGDVYCVKFPNPEEAFEMIEVFYNGNSIHLTRVSYPEKLMANIVVSTIPAGRTAEEEVTKMLANARLGEAEYQHDYHIEKVASEFGEMINIRINDVAPAGSRAPFPLVRPIYNPARRPIESMSIHRSFVYGSNRFEIAVLQLAPDDADESTEAELNHRLTTIADKVVKSLQSCTKQLSKHDAVQTVP